MRALFGLLAVVATLAVAPPASAQAPPVAGVQTHLMWSDVSAEELDQELDDVQALGAKMIRVDVGWSSLQEAGPDQYSGWYLDKLDAVVAEAEARGIELLITITWTPCWASSAPESLKQGCEGSWWQRGVQYYPPTHASDYGNVAGFLADRYRGRVAGWEIWNEPNHHSYFVATNRVHAYVPLVRAAYPEIKRADPGTTVVAGSLSWSDARFTERLFRAGIKGYFDAFSIHPYSGDRSPLYRRKRHSPKTTFARGVPAVHRRMAKYGDHSPLWLTEMGWNTSDVRNSKPWRNGVSEERQARYLKLAFTKMQQWDYVPVAIWFGLENTGTDPMDGGSNYGLVRSDGSYKPAFDAFRETAATIATGRLN